jgi:cutinase
VLPLPIICEGVVMVYTYHAQTPPMSLFRADASFCRVAEIYICSEDASFLFCSKLTVATKTTETGNIGGIVGPPFVAALKSQLGASNVAVQGVNNYPADIPGFLAGGSATGSANMAAVSSLPSPISIARVMLKPSPFQLIQQTMTQCPSTKLCVSGYSQGAQVAHNAAKLISSAATAFINSVVLFGDPDDGSAFGSVPASKVSTDCHLGDDICLHGDLILLPHLDYCLDVGSEATFAVGKSGL